MKYLLIDTNVYIDMIISRDKSNKADSLGLLFKLLDAGQIRLVVPSIVKTELNRHLSTQIKKVGADVEKVSKDLEKLSWINQIEESELFYGEIKKVKLIMNGLKEEFNKNKQKYEEKAKSHFDKLFKHSNTLNISENPEIVFKAQQRKIHKVRPFHYNEKDKDKDSMADSIIVETLINIEEYLKKEPDLEIYFVARNPKDFSTDKKEELHGDIVSSLRDKGIDNKVHYRIHFTKMFLNDFFEEVNNANLSEYLAEIVMLEKEREIEELENFQMENDREFAGLSSLAVDFETMLVEDSEIDSLMFALNEAAEKINESYENYFETYFDLKELLEEKSFEELFRLIENFNNNKPLIEIDVNRSMDSYDIIREIISLVDGICIEVDETEMNVMAEFQDNFQLNTRLASFKNIYGDVYDFKVSGILNPENYGQDTLDIRISKGNRIIGRGEILIDYGFSEFTEEGQIGDAQDTSINIRLGNIIDEIESIKENIISEVFSKHKILSRFIEILTI